MKKTIIFIVLISYGILLSGHPKFPSNKFVETVDFEHIRADSAHGFDVQKYDITLEIDDQTHYIEGTVIADVIAEETLTQIQYELESLNVNEVLVNDEIVTFTHTNGLITIELGTINPGEEFSTSVNYSGYPVLSNDIYHLGMIFGNNYVFTLSDPSGCRWWFPAYDHPWDKAEVDFHVTMRDDWLVACNGIRTGIEDNGNGTKTHHWEGENPMVTFLPCITAANFLEINQDFNEIPIQNFVTGAYYDDAFEDLSNLPFMMEVFSEKYGDYPFEKYGNAIVPMVTFGAMEHQTMTTLGVSFIDGNHGGETTIAHELSHQWFGNCLTPLTWVDVWLSEGFATYSEALYMEEWQGFQAMINYMIVNIQNYYKNWAAGNSYTVYDPDYNNYFTPATYEKPASVLHMLRLLVGNETFFEIMQTYFQTYYNQNVITSEFREVCEQVSGLDLEQFFQQWIFEQGLPAFEYTCFVKDYDTNPEILFCVKTISNTDTEFYQPVPFQVNYRTRTDSIIVDSAPNIPAETIAGPFTTGFEEIEFDPNSWILSRGETFKCMEITGVYGLDNMVVIYWNDLWEDFTVDGYNLYRSESIYEPFEIINSELIAENSYSDNEVINGTTYYYKVNAVKYEDFQSPFSPIVGVTPIDFPLDQGILVIDETRDGTGGQGNPDDEMVDSFYQSVIEPDFTVYDYEAEGEPGLEFLINYSTIIWHDDDLSQHYISDNIDDLGCYLAGGGNLIISGWKTAYEIPLSFINNFSACEQVQVVAAWEFIGASSEDYNDLNIDPDKLNPAFEGTLPYSCIFPEAENGIFNFIGTEGSEYEGEICGLKSQPNGIFVLLGFPLYFFSEDEVNGFLTQLLAEIGETGSDDQIIEAEKFFVITYPNPFKQTTTIYFNTENTEKNTEIIIYNLKGQKVKTFSNQQINRSADHKITWNGNDENQKPVASGIYLYKFNAGNFKVTKKMLLIR